MRTRGQRERICLTMRAISSVVRYNLALEAGFYSHKPEEGVGRDFTIFAKRWYLASVQPALSWPPLVEGSGPDQMMNALPLAISWSERAPSM